MTAICTAPRFLAAGPLQGAEDFSLVKPRAGEYRGNRAARAGSS